MNPCWDEPEIKSKHSNEVLEEETEIMNKMKSEDPVSNSSAEINNIKPDNSASNSISEKSNEGKAVKSKKSAVHTIPMAALLSKLKNNPPEFKITNKSNEIQEPLKKSLSPTQKFNETNNDVSSTFKKLSPPSFAKDNQNFSFSKPKSPPLSGETKLNNPPVPVAREVFHTSKPFATAKEVFNSSSKNNIKSKFFFNSTNLVLVAFINKDIFLLFECTLLEEK